MLQLSLYSFGYHRRGIPKDTSENGGGFVFDCRCLCNPQRIEALKPLHGEDEAVAAHLDANPQAQLYLEQVLALLRMGISVYQDRHYTHLQAAFGCTAGRHRSVYMAARTAHRLRDAVPHLILEHTELGRRYVWP